MSNVISTYQIAYLTGYLLTAWDEEVDLTKIRENINFQYEGKMDPKSPWDIYRFQSRRALMREERLGLEGPYHYPMLARKSGKRILLLSIARKVIEEIVISINEGGSKYFWVIGFNVDNLVNDITSNPGEYGINFVHTRISAFGDSLRAASFYGDDVGEALMFRDNLNLFSCFTCGLIESVTQRDMLRVSAEGLISFVYEGKNKLKEIEKVLGYLREEGYYVLPELLKK